MSEPRETQPSAANEANLARANWVAELVERLEGGEAVDLSALAEAHPEQAEELGRVLPTIRRMISFSRSVARSSGGERSATRPEPVAELGTLGDFRLFREVGRGGMGIVYEAEQVSLHRRVALKILPLAAALDPRHHQRFLVEARAAACLHHTHIVPVHAVGSERGVPYYAMQFIDGCTLAQVLEQLRGQGREGMSTLLTEIAPDATSREHPDEASFPGPKPGPTSSLGTSSHDRAYIRAVAEHGRRAAEALDHAHSRGVLHRDIKPANLMLDAEGHLWITDFGLAQIQGDSRLTLTGDVLGTLRYMSPEQALARRVVIDGRTDIYSLGATLYELLTLRPVFDGADRTEILRRIAQDDPTPVRRLNACVPRDLETIVHKTLAKEPSDRYATARELADDLGRFLDARPIHARPPGHLDHLFKWMRRNRSIVAPAAIFLVVGLVALAGGMIWSNNWLSRHSERLRIERDRAEELSGRLEVQRDLAQERRRVADNHLYAFRVRQAAEALRARRFEQAQEILRDCRPGPDEDDPREFAWHYLWRESRREIAVLSERDEQVRSLAISAEGRRVATGDRDGTIKVRDTETGALRSRFRGQHGPITVLAFSPDGRRLASGASSESGPSLPGRGELLVWQVDNGQLLARFDGFERREIWRLQFDPSGDFLWVQSEPSAGRADIGLWRLEGMTGHLRPRLIRRWWCGRSPSVSADGQRVVAFVDQGLTAVVDEARSGRRLCRLPLMDPGCHGVGLSADGRLLATAKVSISGEPFTLAVWDVDTGRRLIERGDLPGNWSITRFEFSPDRGSLLAQAFDGGMRLYDLGTGKSWANLVDRGEELNSSGRSALLPGGRLLAWSYTNERTGARPLRVYERTKGEQRASFPGRLTALGDWIGMPDGRSIAAISGASAVLWRFEPSPEPQPAGHRDEAWAVAFSPDGRLVATGCDDTDDPQTLKLWDPATGRLLRGRKPHETTTSALAFQPGGRVIASAGLKPEANLRLWDSLTGGLLATLDGHTDKVRTLAFSPDGRLLASAGSDRTIRLWDVTARRCVRSWTGHADTIRQVAFSPDGRTLASASNDARVRLWATASGESLGTWPGDTKVAGVAFSPDGGVVSWAQEDGILQRRDLARGRPLAPLHSEYGELRCLAFSPDGRTVAAAGKSGSIHLWDPVSGQELLTLEGRPCQANTLAFSPEGTSLAGCWHDGSVRLFRAR